MPDENVNETEETPEEAAEEAVEAAAPEAPEAEAEIVDEPAEEQAPVAESEAEAPAAEAEVEAETEAPAAEAAVVDAPAEEVPEAADAEQPVAEAEVAEPPAEEAPEAPARKKKKKRLPRALRPQRTRRKHEPATERKAITRLPKPEHERGRRQERQGTVVSAASDKTIVVRVDVAKVHPMYKKVIRRSTKLHAHDETNQAKVGDIVRIVETRPISRMKRWRLQEIVEAAK